ncbi:MAG: Sarcosine oxidase gamma subunit (EC 1.5.3.1) [Olavius algarvensis Gamma 3 endosymbiont]|nr:MAG: Sarcosine oxidase gamma subunit (EC 1.5.3.1) [Olavius algarvensis Gamma 3 endosymbiont]
MSDLFQQESPLVQIEFGEAKGGGPRIEELPFLGFINLRGRSDNTGFSAGVLKVLGVEAPTMANTVIEAGENRIYWLGPDEWLVVTPAGRQDQVKKDLLAALNGVFCSVVDNSSGLTTVRVSGDNAAATIASDCPLDLHAREFKPGQCAQTRLAKAGTIISPLADGSGFELIIRRSFADYLLHWLQQAVHAFE